MAEKVIGKIAVASGEVLIHRDGKTIVAKVGTELLQGDMITTSGDGKAGIAMIDDSRFSLGSKASMKLDELTFNDTTKTGTMTTSVVKGAFMFVTGSIAKSPGDKATMKVRTSTATIAVRGTEVVGDVQSNGTESKFTLLPNADGHESFAQIENAGGVIVINQPNQTVNVTGFFAPPSEPYQMSPSAVAQTFGQTLLTMNQLSQVMGLPTSVNQATYTPPTYVAPTQIQNDTVAKPVSLLESGNPSIDQLLTKIEASKTKSENLTIEQSNAQAINQQQTVFNAVRQLSLSELIAIRSSVNSGYVFAETKVVTTIGGNIVTFYAPSFAALTLNIPPSAAADIAAATEIQLTPTRGSVLTNDTDADAFPNALSVLAYNSSNMNNTPGAQGSIVSGQFGSLSIASSGSYTYVIDTGKSQVYNSSTTGVVNDIFNYTISDGSANATSTISFTVDFSSLALRTSLTYSSAFISTSTDTLSASSGDILSTSTVVSGTYDASVVVSNFNTNTSFNALGTNITAGNQITGTYGTLTLNPSGTYEYILDPTKTSGIALGSFVTDDFTYTLSNGQTSNFTIMVEGVGTAGIADLVTYTYRYGDTDLVTEGYQGDYYTGYVYVTAGSYDQYMTGVTNANKINTLITENGTQGYYTIDTVTQDQIGVVGLTRVNTYYDTTKGSFVTPYMRGLAGLGSEEGSVAADGRTTGAGTWVYDYANYFFDADLNVVNPASQIQYYTFTYTYGSGEFYTGYGYAASGFTANTTINSSTITGIVGSYYIENVFNIEDTATDNIKVGDVYVKSYHDANGALDDTIVNAVGERGLGSERGNVFSKTTGAADAFDAFSQATISASTSTKELYYFHYEYVAGSGSNDTYYGYGYATAGTYTVNQTLTRTNELGVTGLYTIDAKYSSDVGNVGEVFVTNYYDADHAGWNTTVEGTGSTGLGSEEGNVRNALTGKAADSFSNYYEADVITFVESSETLQEYYYHFTYSSGDTYYGYGTAAKNTYTVGAVSGASIVGEAGTYTIDAIYGTTFGVAGEVYVTSYNDSDGAGWNTSVTGSGTRGLGSEKGSISNYVGSKLDNFNPGDDATLSGTTTLQTYYFHFTYDTGGDIYYGYGTAAANTYTVGNVSGASIVGEKGTYTIDAVYDSYDGTLGEVQVYSYYDAGGLGWNNTVKASSKTGLGSESGAVFDYNGDSDGFDAANDATISTITNSSSALQLYYYHFTYTSGDTYYGYGYLSYTTATTDSSSPYTSGQTLASVTGAKGTYTIDWVYDTTYGTAGEVQVYSYYDADTGGVGWNNTVSGSGKTGLGSESGTITNYKEKSTGFSTDTEADFVATAITNVALTSNVATITTGTAHGYKTGDRVTVDAINTTFDGTYTITGVPDTTTFTYAKTATNVTSIAETGGTVADPTLQLYYFHFTYTTGDTYYGYGYTDSAYTSGQTLASVTGAQGTYTIDWVYDTTYGTAGEVNIYSYYDADTGGVGWDNTVSGSGKTGLGSEEGNITNFSSKSTGFTTASEADFVAAVAGATTALQLYYYHFTYTSGDTYYGYGYLSYTTATTDSSSPYTSGQTLASVTGAKGTYTIDWVYDTTYGTAGEVQVYSYYDADTGGVGWNNTVSGSGKTGLGSESGTITNYKEKSTGFSTDTEADFVATAITNVALTSNVATITTGTAHGYKTGDRVTVDAINTTFDGTYTITGVPDTTTFTYAKTATNVTSIAETGGTVADPTLQLYYFHFTYTTGDTYYGYGYTDSAYTSGQTLASVTGAQGTYTIDWVYDTTYGTAGEVNIYSYYDADTGGVGWDNTVSGSGKTGLGSEEGNITNFSSKSTGFTTASEADFVAAVAGATTALQLYYYHFTYTSGDTYYGYGTTLKSDTTYAVGNITSAQAAAISGEAGTYTIDYVYDTTSGTAGEVQVYSYYDADTGGIGWNNMASGYGKTGLGSESGTVTSYDGLNTSFSTSSEADFSSADLVQYYQFHFTYDTTSPNSGDIYYGYGYAAANTYAVGPITSAQATAITGENGTYTIDYVYNSNKGTKDEVTIYSYYDTDGVYWDNTVSASGKTGLGSESGSITNLGGSTTTFTTASEADFVASNTTLQYYQFHFTYNTTSPNSGDIYYGYGYAAANTYAVGNLTDAQTPAISGEAGIYTIDYVYASTWGTLNRVSVYQYYDADTGVRGAGYNTEVHLEKTITHIARTGTTATITTSGNHGYVVGDYTYIQNTPYSSLNGYFEITSVTATTFNFISSASGTISSIAVSSGTCNNWVAGTNGLGSESGRVVNYNNESGVFTPITEADFTNSVSTLQYYSFRFTYTSGGDVYYGYGYVNKADVTGGAGYTSGQTFNNSSATGTYVIDYVQDGNSAWGMPNQVTVYSYYDADGVGWNSGVLGGGSPSGLGTEIGWVFDWSDTSKQGIFTSAGDADLSIASANSSSPAVGTSTSEIFTQASSTPTVTGGTGLDTLIFSGLTDGTQNINLANVTGIEKIDLGSSASTTYNLNINFDDVFKSDAKAMIVSGLASDDTIDLITSSATRGAVTWVDTPEQTYDYATGNYYDLWTGIDSSAATQNVILLLQQNITVTQVAA
ncbi:VCBS domain-containing protein [Candidatus Methylopumilus planktonicus]|uniref:VCBS domain-containing protein n=1 Tax=Candidatus Methylopumilus planktonicus TaxID=1581557 RepID=UPI003D18F18F